MMSVAWRVAPPRQVLGMAPVTEKKKKKKPMSLFCLIQTQIK